VTGSGGVLGALERVAAWWAVGGGLVLLAVTLVTTVNAGAFIADRVAGLAGASVSALPGYEDVVRLATSCAALMLFPWCQARRGHVAVEFVVQAMPARLRDTLDRLWLAAMAVAMAFLAGWMAVGLVETRADRALSPVLGWSQWPFYAPGVVSLVLAAAVAAAQAAEGVRGAPGGADHGT